jgi:Zn-finger protein
VLVTLESQETKEVVTAELKVLVAPESQEPEMVPDLLLSDSMDAHAQELAPESEMVPDSLPPGSFVCAHCHLVHEDRQAWNRAHSRFWPCSHCNLVHKEYRLTAMLDRFDEFDCLIFIPDLDELEMDGKTIVLSPQVLKMLDEMCVRELIAGNISSLREQKHGALVSKSSN